ncbi:hypothetical protein TREMEDRAFT_42106 [Tremella mesenterica DSM 1558]|uniref:uncharacterized protein n=1 Tax=Tremella mesenterica (strain ATCC 24925 / CBS 8224 / DSM 1558 / NBRC 9311 / NRRL Y-6157 / RJB 2259-6 / UBC 559-6) TaxID=578456 RepID=UPI0003F499A2|nr:uncharacterized protein TREMEDRAFT_42106 [Tremella mesenterica DSM 1558]EIW72950.1 hypothetical protein TREMEDRAFT_42106 [Tremella mesenterica DSM 1558]
MTVKVRSRSPSPFEQSNKRTRRESISIKGIISPSVEDLRVHRQNYLQATPYRHAVVGGLLSDELLESFVEETKTYGVRGEDGSLPGWGWEQKETDIYKIRQTPDLSSLDPKHLPEGTLRALPQSAALKNALYSQEFRNLVRQVTGCGPLSGSKTDLSVGLYTQGSHLLLHDDSISTRLISFILYLPNSPLDAPSSSDTSLIISADGQFLKGWNPAWGGALELYPVESGEEVGLPGVKRTLKVDVKWGQIVFFEVQPGRSYHSVEEVIVGDGRQRLGVSGWFHRPVEGEEGYEVEDAAKKKQDLSSLAQITSAPTIPFTPYNDEPPLGLKPTHLTFLSDFLAPSYLNPQTLERLSQQFAAASEIVMHSVLLPELAEELKRETEAVDKADYPDRLIPPQDLGEGDGWKLQGPTSKHRYASLSSSSSRTPHLHRILFELIPSEAFRAWLSVVSSLAPVGYRAEGRRFRHGLDYTLANGEDKNGEARLDVCLGLTWWADVQPGSDEEDGLIEHGGWDCYLAAPDENEDPAVYQSSRAVKVNDHQEDNELGNKPDTQEPNETSKGESSQADRPKEESGDGQGDLEDGEDQEDANGTIELEIDPDQLSPSDFDSDSDADANDDGPLLTQAVCFNRLVLVLRDPGVMKFTKYLSASAPGSRWDVSGEWEVGVLEEDDEGAEGKEIVGKVEA